MKRFGFLCLVLSLSGATVACTAPSTSSKGQMITCTTDPGTGVITRCETGSGSGSGSNQCHDIDEDGDGEPHDGSGSDDRGSNSNFVAPDDHGGDGSGSDTDSDGDGIPDDQDCDNHPGEDDNPNPDLPYDVRPALGSTARPIQDAFAEEGVQPAVIDSVTMDGGSWRLAELQADTPFLVTEDDCTHAGNRDVGRDRVIVTWQDTATAATQSDHLDIRYCK